MQSAVGLNISRKIVGKHFIFQILKFKSSSQDVYESLLYIYTQPIYTSITRPDAVAALWCKEAS